MISCPECGAPAEVRETAAAPCHTGEMISSRGATYVAEADEVLAIVEVRCAAGHRFVGPAEMLEGAGDVWLPEVA